jgi:hypothetical protein
MATAQHTTKPLDNLTYDIVSILHEKSQALEAYDTYIEDAQIDPDAAKLLDDIRRRNGQRDLTPSPARSTEPPSPA